MFSDSFEPIIFLPALPFHTVAILKEQNLL